MSFKLHYLGHKVIENNPFVIDRPEGSYRYLFFHFISAAKIEIDGKVYDVTPGSCILYKPGAPQKFFVEKNRLNHDYLDFTIEDVSFFNEIRLPLGKVFNPRSSDLVSDTIANIHKEINSNRVGNSFIVSSLMTTLFVSLSRRIHNHSVGENRVYFDELKHQFENVRLSMYHNPSDFSVKFMAEKLNFSPPYFSSLYKRFFDVSPIEDLTDARISFVKKLIDQNESTQVIVKKLGFYSQEYYYRWFKKYFGVTQSMYKKNIRK